MQSIYPLIYICVCSFISLPATKQPHHEPALAHYPLHLNIQLHQGFSLSGLLRYSWDRQSNNNTIWQRGREKKEQRGEQQDQELLQGCLLLMRGLKEHGEILYFS